MKRNRTLFIISVSLIAAAGMFWLVKTSRAATETPAYRVVRSDGRFEIRDYPPLTLAGTAMEGEDMDRSFMRLFRFITGQNDASEKIAMTTPVLIGTESAKKTMKFIMPDKTVGKGVPKPSTGNVTLVKVEAARFAVLRFGGGRSSVNEAKAIAKLKAWLEAQKISAEGAPVLAYYDPPWTPVFLRRNEVMLRLKK